MILFTNCADGDKRLARMAQCRSHDAQHVRTSLSQEQDCVCQLVCYLSVTGSKLAEPAGRDINDATPGDDPDAAAGTEASLSSTKLRKTPWNIAF
jgi:hypothetical protein